MEWQRCLAGLSIFLFLKSAVFSQIGDFESSAMRRQAVAEAFAPIIYQQESLELLDGSSGFHPVDSILSFDFDGNQDLRDNARNAFLLSAEQTRRALEGVEIYYSVIESRSHFYLNYIVYHALDTNGFGHAHDSENVFVIVRKTKDFPGDLEVVITNAHGFPNIYSPRVSVEAQWRSRAESSIARGFLLAIDSSAKPHHLSESLMLVARGVGESPVVFSHMNSHALYKFSARAWREEHHVGSLYVSRSCGECLLAPLEVSGIRRIHYYRLRDFDQMMLSVRPEMDWSPVFVGWKKNLKVLRSVYRERELPGYLAAGVLEAQPAANLFFRKSFKTAYPLSDPIAFHRYFDRESQEISGQYLLNAYLED